MLWAILQLFLALSFGLWKSCSMIRGVPRKFCGASPAPKSIDIFDLTSQPISFAEGLELQRTMFDRMSKAQGLSNHYDSISGEVVAVQHLPVYTMGSGTKPTSGPFIDSCTTSGLSYQSVVVDRAGDITFHGPGQVVIYPVVDLNYFGKDLNWYLRALEQVVINTAGSFGVLADRKMEPGYTGVWVGQAKIAAIGLKVSRWITTHGVSVNVAPDMRYFANIVPCGISDPDKRVGALVDFAPQVTLPEVAAELLRQIAQVLGVSVRGSYAGDEALRHLLRSELRLSST